VPIVKRIILVLRPVVLFFAGSLAAFPAMTGALSGAPQGQEHVKLVPPPVTPLPPEAQSRDVSRFSFIAYRDTRGRRDGVAIQYEHSLVVDSMIAQVKRLQTTKYPVRFVLQSGDAVVNGRDTQQWNISFVPVISRLTTEGGVPYFLVPGNHEATDTPAGLRNYLDAMCDRVLSPSPVLFRSAWRGQPGTAHPGSAGALHAAL